ncbi:MAG TPA: hypothetical protein VEL28_10955 [Candidatus Binatia bacterium]|nr:hypothetical protein [Candidatus Binatia bacterium]
MQDPPRRATHSRLRAIAIAVIGVALVSTIGAAVVRAGSCRVLVALGSMQVEPTVSGAFIRLGGTWEFDNLLQVANGLSFNILVSRDDNFVRLNYPDKAYRGNFPGLAQDIDDGLDGNKLLGIEAAGTIDINSNIVSIEAQRMKLALPIPSGVGPLTVIAYLVIDGDYISPIISNTLSRSLKEIEEIPARKDTIGVVQ